jgi:hypothetical protein
MLEIDEQLHSWWLLKKGSALWSELVKIGQADSEHLTFLFQAVGTVSSTSMITVVWALIAESYRYQDSGTCTDYCEK